MWRGAPREIEGRREASKLLSFVECHGLSVTRSKAAAGRRKAEGGRRAGSAWPKDIRTRGKRSDPEPLLHVSLARQLSIV